MIAAGTEKTPGSFEKAHRRLWVAGLAACLCVAAVLLWAPMAPAATNNIFTVAGVGTPGGFSGDGGPAIAAHVAHPDAVSVTADGGFLIADTDNQRIRRVSPAGTITTVAGNGTEGFSGDGGPATDAELARPFGVAATADGGFLIADTFNSRVRRVSPTGTITTVAGSDNAGDGGDGGPATDAELFNPIGVAPTLDGGFLIGDTDNARVRRVSAAGTITTVAGNGTEGFGGDGGPATDAQLTQPSGLALTADGGFLIADYGNNRVRRVSAAGTITTVAGNGSAGFSGDGGPAIAASMFAPASVAATADGGFVIADSLNARVRRVSVAGTMTTVAGNGTQGFSGDGGLATDAQLTLPQGVAATADGGFLIADFEGERVRFVDADLGIPPRPQGPALQEPAPQRPAPQGPLPQALASPQVPAGPASPAGPAQPVSRAPLALAFADSRLRARARRMLTVRYAATDSASVVVRIMRGRRTVARARGRARAAANRIRIRAPRRAGRYRLRLEARTPDGRSATARAVLIVRRAR